MVSQAAGRSEGQHPVFLDLSGLQVAADGPPSDDGQLELAGSQRCEDGVCVTDLQLQLEPGVLVLDPCQVAREQVGAWYRGATDLEWPSSSFLQLPDGLDGLSSFCERGDGVGDEGLAGRCHPGAAA